MHVQAWLERAALLAPSTTAIEDSHGKLTYSELFAQARRGAQELRERGVRRGERVALALPAGREFATAFHSCLLLGAVAVPLDLRLTAYERGRIAANAALVVDEPLDEPLRARSSASEAAPRAAHPSGRRDERQGAARTGRALVRSRGREPLVLRHDLDAVAVVIHTSGTTSIPKPVGLTYGNLLWSALGSAAALGLDPEERWLCVLPLSHVGGLSILVRSAIYSTTAVIHARFDTSRVHDALMGENITLVSLVSTTLCRLLDAGLCAPPRLRCALTGGGPVPPALGQRARAAGIPVCETYGLTECCSQAATSPPALWTAGRDAPGQAFGPLAGGGAPLFCTSVQIAGDGEILLSGPTVSPDALAPDGRLHTGDLGRLDEQGFLHVTGRKADTIVTGGENVVPTEVEAVLEAHPAVAEAAVVGRADPQWGEAVNAIVVVVRGSTVSEAELRTHCAQALAPFKVPKRFALVSEPLPRTSSGKLLRREL